MNPDLCVQRPIVDLSVKIKYLKLLYIDVPGQVSLTATVTCNQYYLLSCGADGAR